MTPAELRELADRAEAVALKRAKEAVGQHSHTDWHADQAEQANRLFLMARNLRQRAMEMEIEAAQKRAGELMEAHREAARNAETVRNI